MLIMIKFYFLIGSQLTSKNANSSHVLHVLNYLACSWQSMLTCPTVEIY